MLGEGTATGSEAACLFLLFFDGSSLHFILLILLILQSCVWFDSVKLFVSARADWNRVLPLRPAGCHQLCVTESLDLTP